MDVKVEARLLNGHRVLHVIINSKEYVFVNQFRRRLLAFLPKERFLNFTKDCGIERFKMLEPEELEKVNNLMLKMSGKANFVEPRCTFMSLESAWRLLRHVSDQLGRPLEELTADPLRSLSSPSRSWSGSEDSHKNASQRTDAHPARPQLLVKQEPDVDVKPNLAELNSQLTSNWSLFPCTRQFSDKPVHTKRRYLGRKSEISQQDMAGEASKQSGGKHFDIEIEPHLHQIHKDRAAATIPCDIPENNAQTGLSSPNENTGINTETQNMQPSHEGNTGKDTTINTDKDSPIHSSTNGIETGPTIQGTMSSQTNEPAALTRPGNTAENEHRDESDVNRIRSEFSDVSDNQSRTQTKGLSKDDTFLHNKNEVSATELNNNVVSKVKQPNLRRKSSDMVECLIDKETMFSEEYDNPNEFSDTINKAKGNTVTRAATKTKKQKRKSTDMLKCLPDKQVKVSKLSDNATSRENETGKVTESDHTSIEVRRDNVDIIIDSIVKESLASQTTVSGEIVESIHANDTPFKKAHVGTKTKKEKAKRKSTDMLEDAPRLKQCRLQEDASSDSDVVPLAQLSRRAQMLKSRDTSNACTSKSVLVTCHSDTNASSDSAMATAAIEPAKQIQNKLLTNVTPKMDIPQNLNTEEILKVLPRLQKNQTKVKENKLAAAPPTELDVLQSDRTKSPKFKVTLQPEIGTMVATKFPTGVLTFDDTKTVRYLQVDDTRFIYKEDIFEHLLTPVSRTSLYGSRNFHTLLKKLNIKKLDMSKSNPNEYALLPKYLQKVARFLIAEKDVKRVYGKFLAYQEKRRAGFLPNRGVKTPTAVDREPEEEAGSSHGDQHTSSAAESNGKTSMSNGTTHHHIPQNKDSSSVSSNSTSKVQGAVIHTITANQPVPYTKSLLGWDSLQLPMDSTMNQSSITLHGMSVLGTVTTPGLSKSTYDQSTANSTVLELGIPAKSTRNTTAKLSAKSSGKSSAEVASKLPAKSPGKPSTKSPRRSRAKTTAKSNTALDIENMWDSRAAPGEKDTGSRVMSTDPISSEEATQASGAVLPARAQVMIKHLRQTLASLELERDEARGALAGVQKERDEARSLLAKASTFQENVCKQLERFVELHLQYNRDFQQLQKDVTSEQQTLDRFCHNVSELHSTLGGREAASASH